MGKSSFATGNALTRKVYSEKLFRDTVKELFWQRLMSNDGSSAVHVKSDLEAGKGDAVTYGIRMRITGPGVTEGETLEGNEESLTTYSYTLTLNQYRNAVRDDGAMSRKRVAFDLDDESRTALLDWGSEKIDQLLFDAAEIGSGADSNPTKVFYNDSSGDPAAGSAATAKAGLHATNSKLDPTLVRTLKAWAKTGGGRTYVPLRPIKYKGQNFYYMVVHPDCLYDFKENSTYAQYLREAEVRGQENPLFTGAVAVIDGVIIFEHENCATATDGGGGSVAWAKCMFGGAQSLCWGWGRRPKYIEDDFDYGNEHGKAWDIIAAPGKPQFNSLDYGSLGVWLSRTDVSGL